MKYITNSDTQKAIFYNEEKLTEKEAQQIIGSEDEVRDGSEWDRYNIVPADKVFQIVNYERDEEIDPIFYCYQYREGEINYDAGSWNLEEAVDEAKTFSVDYYVEAIGICENYCYEQYDVLGNPDYKHEFESFEELQDFVERREEDEEAHYYFGNLYSFDRELFTIDDIRRNMQPEWFEDDEVCTVYEWDMHNDWYEEV